MAASSSCAESRCEHTASCPPPPDSGLESTTDENSDSEATTALDEDSETTPSTEPRSPSPDEDTEATTPNRTTDESSSGSSDEFPDGGSTGSTGTTEQPFESPFEVPPLIPLPIPVSDTEEETDTPWDAATATPDASLGEVPTEPDEEPPPSSYCLTPSWQNQPDSASSNPHSTSQGTLCIPEAFGVPGKSGPPQWLSGDDVEPKLDDPRWVGSTLQSYPVHDSSAQAQFRALVKSNILYVSFHALVDPAGTGVGQQDWVYLALAQDETSPAKIVGVKVNTSTPSPDVQSGGGVTSAHYFQATSPISTWTGELADWAQDVGVWRDASGAWAINFKVDLNSLGITTTPLRMWAGIVVQASTAPPSYVTYSWPLGTTGAISANAATPPPGITGTPDTITNIDEWGDVHWGDDTICNSGVSLACDQIGVLDGTTLTHRISSALENNTFAVRPAYNGAASPAVNRIAARFRIATWSPGDTIDWTNLDEYEGVQSNAMGRMERTCSPEAAPGGDPPPCPIVEADAPMHQCVLVTLGAGSVPGSQAIMFLNDSLYYCACAEGHFGPACDTCAPGYDDTTTPGICAPR